MRERIQAGCLVLGLSLLASYHPNFMAAKRSMRGQAAQGKGAGSQISTWVEPRRQEARLFQVLEQIEETVTHILVERPQGRL